MEVLIIESPFGEFFWPRYFMRKLIVVIAVTQGHDMAFQRGKTSL
jgi:hypothetical protein